jgi:hypothetical protein
MKRVNDLPTTYNEASELLGESSSKTIANNTRLHRMSERSIGLELHDTVVVEFENGLGSLTLFTGGWQTVTTKQRINACLGHRGRVYAEKRIWFYRCAVTGQTVPFNEGLLIDDEGNPLRDSTGVIGCTTHAQ